MKNLYIVTIFFIFMLSACSVSKIHNGNISEYAENIVWTLKTDSYYPYVKHLQKGKYIYFIETAEENLFSLAKVDLENGKFLWKTQKIKGSPESRPVMFEINGKGYIMIEEYNTTNLYCIDDLTGNLSATLIFTLDSKELSWYRNGEFIVSNGMLYKAVRKKITNDDYGCFAQVDLSGIDFKQPPETPQLVKTKILLEKKQIICVTPTEKDGVIFLNTYDYFHEDGYTEVIAYDTNTDRVKWEYTSNVLDGNGRFNMYIVDNLLYIIEEQIACFNIESGECIYEYKETEEDLVTKISKGGSIWSQGLWYDDGKFYYTSNASWATPSMTNIPKDLVRNVLCLDANTFELVWSDFPEGCGSLFTRPVVIDGKCFVLVNDGLRVYNSKTGELIGRASEVNGSAHSLNAEYNGMFIYFDIDDLQKTSTLTAIRP